MLPWMLVPRKYRALAILRFTQALAIVLIGLAAIQGAVVCQGIVALVVSFVGGRALFRYLRSRHDTAPTHAEAEPETLTSSTLPEAAE